MFKVDKNTKKIEALDTLDTFAALGLKERQDLQEWIASNPIVLGEELLIIQKEFAGFSKTKERLDLLALDKRGNIVVIENKLDDSGRDVVWQAIKYASYVSSVTIGEILEVYKLYLDSIRRNDNRTASQMLTDFFGVEDLSEITINAQNTQRIILVSKSFREEVLSAANWLIGYGVAVSCIKIKPYKYGEAILLDSEQILPQKELKDYTMKLVLKTKEEQVQREDNAARYNIRNSFWKNFLPEFNNHSRLCENRSAENSKNHWFSAASGISGVSYTFLICKEYCGVELTIAKSGKAENKKIFDILSVNKEKIERLFGVALSWERLNDAIMSRIILRNYELSLYNEEQWVDITTFLIENMIKLEKALKTELLQIKRM